MQNNQETSSSAQAQKIEHPYPEHFEVDAQHHTDDEHHNDHSHGSTIEDDRVASKLARYCFIYLTIHCIPRIVYYLASCAAAIVMTVLVTAKEKYFDSYSGGHAIAGVIGGLMATLIELVFLISKIKTPALQRLNNFGDGFLAVLLGTLFQSLCTILMFYGVCMAISPQTSAFYFVIIYVVCGLALSLMKHVKQSNGNTMEGFLLLNCAMLQNKYEVKEDEQGNLVTQKTGSFTVTQTKETSGNIVTVTTRAITSEYSGKPWRKLSIVSLWGATYLAIQLVFMVLCVGCLIGVFFFPRN